MNNPKDVAEADTRERARERIIWKSWIECPRPWGIYAAITGTAVNMDLECRVLAHDKGWIREYLAFEIIGPRYRVEQMQQWFKEIGE